MKVYYVGEMFSPEMFGFKVNKFFQLLEERFPGVRFTGDYNELNLLVAGNGYEQVEDLEIDAAVLALVEDEDMYEFAPEMVRALISAWESEYGRLDRPDARDMLRTLMVFADIDAFCRYMIAVNKLPNSGEYWWVIDQYLPAYYNRKPEPDSGDLWSFYGPDGEFCVVTVP